MTQTIEIKEVERKKRLHTSANKLEIGRIYSCTNKNDGGDYYIRINKDDILIFSPPPEDESDNPHTFEVEFLQDEGYQFFPAPRGTTITITFTEE